MITIKDVVKGFRYQNSTGRIVVVEFVDAPDQYERIFVRTAIRLAPHPLPQGGFSARGTVVRHIVKASEIVSFVNGEAR